VFGRGETISIESLAGVSVAVDDLLPAPEPDENPFL
jgi:hypothetical protein